MEPMNTIPYHTPVSNTPDLVVTALRNAILQGRYKTGQPLRQDRVAKDLGVSKIPLREALVELRAEGLVTLLPKRGAVVSELSAAQAKEIYTMRSALETAALEQAVPLLGNAEIIRARSVLEIMETGADKHQWGELNWEFHATLYQAARMPMMLKTIHQLHNNVTRYLLLYLDRLSAWQRSREEHRALLNACRDKNTSQAVAILKTHLAKASDTLAAYLSNTDVGKDTPAS